MSSVGTHSPMKLLTCFLPDTCSAADTPIAPIAAHRNVSEGSFAVCCSMPRAISPSECSIGSMNCAISCLQVLTGLLPQSLHHDDAHVCPARTAVSRDSMQAASPSASEGMTQPRVLLKALYIGRRAGLHALAV